MKVLLKDKTEIYISESQANILKEELLTNDDGFIKIGGQTIRKSRVVEIRTGGLRSVDIPDFNTPVIEDSKCQGQYSIQAEINRIANEEHPKEWSKLIRDKQWRESTRQTLRGLTDKWCDYRAHECACE